MFNPIPYYDFGGVGPLLHFAHANAYPPASYRQFIAPFLSRFSVRSICQRPLWPESDPAELQGDWHLIADDLIRFFEQQGWQNVIGIGHSLGAVATMYAAVKRPFLFRVLVLIEPVFLPPQVLQAAAAYPDRTGDLPLVQGALRRRNHWPTRQAAFDRFRQKEVFRRWSDEALWAYVHSALREQGGEFVLAFPREWEAQIYANPPQAVWDTLPKLTQPTLAVRAAESDTIFPAAWDLWQSKQPQAKFVQIEDAGHMLTMERPLSTAQIIVDWLAQIL